MYSYKAFGLSIISEILLPELSAGSSVENYDLRIIRDKIILPELKKTKIYRRGICAEFGQNSNHDLYLQWNKVASFRATEGNTLRIDAFTEDNDVLSLFTVSEALGLILFQKGYFLLHASSIRIGETAWCFMGNPGAGKSTTAAAFVKAGCDLLSDDLTAIKFNESGEAFVIPAYPQLKIWDRTVQGLQYDKSQLQPVSEGVNKFSYHPRFGFPDQPVKLGQVIFLHKARNQPAYKVLHAKEIPTETIKNFPLPSELLTNEALRNHFIQSFQCAKNATMSRLRRPNGFSLLEKWVKERILLETTDYQNAVS